MPSARGLPVSLSSTLLISQGKFVRLATSIRRSRPKSAIRVCFQLFIINIVRKKKSFVCQWYLKIPDLIKVKNCKIQILPFENLDSHFQTTSHYPFSHTNYRDYWKCLKMPKEVFSKATSILPKSWFPKTAQWIPNWFITATICSPWVKELTGKN